MVRGTYGTPSPATVFPPPVTHGVHVDVVVSGTNCQTLTICSGQACGQRQSRGQ